ncbi:MAG TPA: hypothetical protein VGN01_13660 [Acidobacteriaceae bacterium]
MPLIEVNQTRKVLTSVRLDESILSQINQYAAFIKASPDEVINKGLEYLFSKDRDFAAFRSTDEPHRAPELLRPRKAASPNGSKPLPREPLNGAEPAASVTGLKA